MTQRGWLAFRGDRLPGPEVSEEENSQEVTEILGRQAGLCGGLKRALSWFHLNLQKRLHLLPSHILVMLRHLCVKHILPRLCWVLSALKCWFFLKWISLIVPTLEKDGIFSIRTPLQKWDSNAQTWAVLGCSKGTTLLLEGACSVLFLGEASQASHLPGSTFLSRTRGPGRGWETMAAAAGLQLCEPVACDSSQLFSLWATPGALSLSPSLFWLAAHLRWESIVKFYLLSARAKGMSSGPITSWQIDGETVETVTDFIF